MVKPVNHDMGSSLTTAGWSAGKWAIVGAVVPALLAGLAVGGIAYAGMALVTGGGASAIGAFLASKAGVATVIGGLAAVGAFAYSATWGAVIGGVTGLLKGGSRISAEKQRYEEKVAHRHHNAAAQMQQAAMAGMQQGYEQGMQDGQQLVVNKLREAQEQMLMAHAKGGHAHMSKVEALNKERAAQAAATPQVG